MLKDLGAQPSAVVGLRWTSDSGWDDIYLAANSINNGVWGYNNLQWLGGIYYHKFNDYWHIAFETRNIHEFRVPKLDNPIAAAAIAGGGTSFSPQIMPFNAPYAARCGNSATLTCTADEQAFLLYVTIHQTNQTTSPRELNFSWTRRGNGPASSPTMLMQRWHGNIGSRRKSKYAPRSPTIAP